MKIIRDGQEFVLTPQELVDAYKEQEHIYDQMNIRDNMEGYLEPVVYERLKTNEDFIETAADILRQKQDDGMGYDRALSDAICETVEEFLLPVNHVTIVRERYSEHEIWDDYFWVAASKTPSKELFQEAVEAFLFTKAGQDAVEATCRDFNWGDAFMDVPDEIWNKFGIYPIDFYSTPKEMGLSPASNITFSKFFVDQDEVLIPSDYFDKIEALENKPSLADQILSASARAVEQQSTSIPQTKSQEPQH